MNNFCYKFGNVENCLAYVLFEYEGDDGGLM